MIVWFIIMSLISMIPFFMKKHGTYMTARDLFFTSIGMIVSGMLGIIILYTK